MDNAGNLYIADSRNGRIREVSAQTGIINTIVGGGTCATAPCGDGGFATNAQLGNAQSGSNFQLSLDSQGNLYLSDAVDDEVRAIPATATAVSFGSQSLGVESAQTFTVNNIGAQPLSLTGLTVATTYPTPAPSPSDFLQIASGGADCAANMTVAVGQDCVIDMQWFPTVVTTVAQPETGTMTVASNATNSTSGNNAISLSGTGIGSSGTTAQTITFPALKPSYPYETKITLAATTNAADPSLTIIYRAIGPATLSGTTLTPTGVGTVTVTAYQFGNSQYASATPQSQTFTVTQAPLTVSATSLSLTVGTAVPQPTFTITGFVGSDNQASVVTGTPVLTITNTAGTVTPVGSIPSDGTYTITITQGNLSAGPNYALNFVNGTLSVTGAQGQMINFTALPNVTYGVSPITLSAVSVDARTNAATGLPITFTLSSSSSSIASIAGNLLTVTGAGAVAVTATQSGSTNYAAATPETVSFTVAPAPLTVTAGNLTVAQNAPLPTLTSDYSFSGFVNGDTAAAVPGTPVLSTTAADTSTLGPYAINIAQGSMTSANYTFAKFVPGTLTVVTGTAQTISFPAISSVVYGSAPITLTAKSNSGLGVSYLVTSGPATVAGSALSITGAGSVTVTASQPGAGAYSPAAPVSQTFTVAPAVLTLTANNATRVDDTPNPAFTYTLNGFVNGDTQGSATSGTPQLTTTATAGSPVGTYAIIPVAAGSITAANYTFTLVDGTLTITSGGPVATFSLTATPQQLSLVTGDSVQTTITLTPQNYYQGLVTLSCGTLPANVQCIFTPATVSPDGTATAQTTTLTITTNSAATVVAGLMRKDSMQVHSAAIFYLPGALTGLLILFYRKRLMKSAWGQRLLVLAILLAGLTGLSACGGSSKSSTSQTATPGTYTVTVTAKGQDGTTNVVPISIQIL